MLLGVVVVCLFSLIFSILVGYGRPILSLHDCLFPVGGYEVCSVPQSGTRGSWASCMVSIRRWGQTGFQNAPVDALSRGAAL